MDRPALFDTHLLARRRDRAVRLGFAGGADFLHREAAAIIAERLEEIARPFDAVAVIGSGGGAYARALARPGRQIVEVEPSPGMAALCPGVVTIADPDPLPLAEGAFDLILSGLWLHWCNDPVGQLVQMRRALKPDGLMIAAMFGGRTLAGLRAALAEAEVEATGGLSPRVAPMGEIRDLGALLQRAGYAMPVADSERLEVTHADPLALLHELRAMGETNLMTDRLKGFTRRGVLIGAMERLAAAADSDGRLRTTFEIVFLTGWAPAPDQPKPLRPGSASARLADALGTEEVPTGEKPGR